MKAALQVGGVRLAVALGDAELVDDLPLDIEDLHAQGVVLDRKEAEVMAPGRAGQQRMLHRPVKHGPAPAGGDVGRAALGVGFAQQRAEALVHVGVALEDGVDARPVPGPQGLGVLPGAALGPAETQARNVVEDKLPLGLGPGQLILAPGEGVDLPVVVVQTDKEGLAPGETVIALAALGQTQQPVVPAVAVVVTPGGIDGHALAQTFERIEKLRAPLVVAVAHVNQVAGRDDELDLVPDHHLDQRPVSLHPVAAVAVGGEDDFLRIDLGRSEGVPVAPQARGRDAVLVRRAGLELPQRGLVDVDRRQRRLVEIAGTILDLGDRAREGNACSLEAGDLVVNLPGALGVAFPDQSRLVRTDMKQQRTLGDPRSAGRGGGRRLGGGGGPASTAAGGPGVAVAGRGGRRQGGKHQDFQVEPPRETRRRNGRRRHHVP